MPGYALVVAKGGPKLEKWVEGQSKAEWPDGLPAQKGSTGMMMYPNGVQRIRGKGVTVAMIARSLSSLLGAPIADLTQLAGEYDFEVEASSEETRMGASKIIGGEVPPDPLAGGEPGVSIFASVKRLGLNLEARKVPVDMIVVDHAEKKPTEN